MKFLRRILILLAAAAILSSATAYAWDSSQEVLRLKKEVPDIGTFGGSGSVIWLRGNESRLLNDGSMENFRSLVLMIGERVPEDWKELSFAVPEGGSLTIEDASWYSTMNGMKEGSLPQQEIKLDGGALVKKITVPETAVGRVVVIALREVRAKRLGLDTTVNMADSLPIWEQNVSVELPVGTELYWAGRDMKAPEKQKQGSTEKYSWQVMNQTPWNGGSFVINERPLVSFSTKKGGAEAIKLGDALAASLSGVSMPSAAKAKGKSGPAALIEYTCSPARTLTGVPARLVRSPLELPPEGPWTPWEQTLLLHNWLPKLGWHSQLLWDAKLALDEDSPASLSILEAPVLQLSGGGSKPSYFMAGLPFSQTRVPAAIAGSELFGLKGDALTTKQLSSGSPAENRLALFWHLKLDDMGRAAGKLEITATGGWSDQFSANEAPSVENLEKFLSKKINFAIPGMSLKPTEVKKMPFGYRLGFNVECAPGLVHGTSMLLRLPGGIPNLVTQLISKEKSLTLRFPFMIDQKVRMQMPGGFRLLQTPPLKQLGEGSGAVLKETVTHWPKKARLEADSLWVVKTRKIDEKMAPLLKEELAAALRWPVLDLPFKKNK